jgi:TolB-like protein/cytochrome c-type biogenesis protein CcmH/NrfG
MGDIFLFEGFRLDRRSGGLFRETDGSAPIPVATGSRALDLLGLLVERHGDLVSKDEIMDAVWPGTVVEDNNLTVQISALRRILDHGRVVEGSCIQTVAGRGYRFVAAVAHHETAAPLDGEAAAERGIRPAPRLSIVVLPFTNLSNDPEQQYFADGITYRGKTIETKLIGRELGVRYVLEGSVRRADNQVRVNAQLIDAESNAHLWAERFGCDNSDLFTLQDEITSRIAVALDLALIATEAARQTENPDALEYTLRGRAAFNKGPSRNNLAEAIGLFEHALALDPHSVEAQSWLARVLMVRVLSGMADSAAVDIARAEGLAGQALATSPTNPPAHYAKGQVLRARRRYAQAIPEYEMVLAYNGNSVNALHALGQCKLFAGSIEETIPLEEQAIRLSPRDPQVGIWYLQIANVHLLQSHTSQAILWLEKACSANPTQPSVHAWLASAYGLKGESERAVAELAEAGRLSPDDRYSSIARLRAVAGPYGIPKIRALFEATYFVGLRKAGMPEE